MSNTQFDDKERGVCPDCSEPLVHLSERSVPWDDFTAKYVLELITGKKVDGEGPQYICVKCLLKFPMAMTWSYKITTGETDSGAGPRKSEEFLSNASSKNLSGNALASAAKVRCFSEERVAGRASEESQHAASSSMSPSIGATDKQIYYYKLQCKECGKVFASEYGLKSHQRLHDSSRKYACEICHLRFFNLQTASQHQWVHSQSNTYQCSICQKNFKSERNLEFHKKVHADKCHTCPDCGKSFSMKRYLNDHLRMHTGEKPYTCDICNRSFRLNGNLIIHRRIHTGEKPFACEICSKKFAQRWQRNRHRRIHQRMSKVSESIIYE